MPSLLDVDGFETLPLWAQTLIAARMVRRGALAMMADGPRDAHEAIMRGCDAIERCAAEGDGMHRERRVLGGAVAARVNPGGRAAVDAMRWAIDAAEAAQAANDFPVDATVTRSARLAIAALAHDPRVTPMQVMILLRSDIDQVRFACDEAGIQTYNGVTGHVLGRLAPVHALTLTKPASTPESGAR
ncbi:MAG: hypothetical protein AB7G11_06675 [Phycisphaerales bacterium]